jgi:Flp pilus assembly protein TadD
MEIIAARSYSFGITQIDAGNFPEAAKDFRLAAGRTHDSEMQRKLTVWSDALNGKAIDKNNPGMAALTHHKYSEAQVLFNKAATEETKNEKVQRDKDLTELATKLVQFYPRAPGTK